MRSLGRLLPLIRIVPEYQPRSRLLHLLESTQGLDRRFAAVPERGQPQLLERPPHVTSVRGEDDLASGVQPQAQRLSTRRMPIARNANHAPVAEQVVLSLQLQHLMAQIEVSAVVCVAPDQFGVMARAPFALLHHQLRVWYLSIAAYMIEVKMRGYQVANLCRINSDRFQPRADLLAGRIDGGKNVRERAEPPAWIGLQLRMQPAVEQHFPLGMFYQVARYRHFDPAGFFLEKTAKVALEPTACHRGQGNAHLKPPLQSTRRLDSSARTFNKRPATCCAQIAGSKSRLSPLC